MNERLQTFLYLLVRDELPAGTVERLLVEAEKVDVLGEPRRASFSSPTLADLAEVWTRRLTGGRKHDA